MSIETSAARTLVNDMLIRNTHIAKTVQATMIKAAARMSSLANTGEATRRSSNTSGQCRPTPGNAYLGTYVLSMIDTGTEHQPGKCAIAANVPQQSTTKQDCHSLGQGRDSC